MPKKLELGVTIRVTESGASQTVSCKGTLSNAISTQSVCSGDWDPAFPASSQVMPLLTPLLLVPGRTGSSTNDMHLPGGTNKNTAPQTSPPAPETLIQWVKDRCQRFLFFSRTLGNSSHQKIWDDIDLVQNLLMRERQTCGWSLPVKGALTERKFAWP